MKMEKFTNEVLSKDEDVMRKAKNADISFLLGNNTSVPQGIGQSPIRPIDGLKECVRIINESRK